MADLTMTLTITEDQARTIMAAAAFLGDDDPLKGRIITALAYARRRQSVEAERPQGCARCGESLYGRDDDEEPLDGRAEEGEEDDREEEDREEDDRDHCLADMPEDALCDECEDLWEREEGR